MKKIDVSIIVPVHNTPENIFEECLTCLVSQTYQNIEIICVDDASTNNETIEVLNTYVSKYATIIKPIWLKENVGAAQARNIGLANASGEYIIFLDSDDIFMPTFISSLYEKITKTQSDVCLCELSYFSGNFSKENVFNTSQMRFEIKGILGNSDMLCKINASGCNRLCKVDYLKEHNIYFQTLAADNDMYFALMTILCSRNICQVHNTELMYYRFNTAFQISSNINPLNLQKAIKKTKEDASINSVYTNYLEMIELYECFTAVYEMSVCKNESDVEQFYNNYRSQLRKSKRDYSNTKYKFVIEMWERYDYKSKWFSLGGKYLDQLKLNSSLFKWKINDVCQVVIWGMGKRGQAIEEWCKDEEIHVIGITDIRDDCIGGETRLGNPILDSESVISSEETVIASNTKIYSYLCKKIPAYRVINAEQYCPL